MKKLIYCIFIIALLSCSKKIDIKPLDKKYYADNENNNSLKTAYEVTIQQNPIIGFFNKNKNGADIDYYKVNFAIKNTSYKIILSGVPGIDSKMEFYLPNGNLLFKIDQNGIGEPEVMPEYYPNTDYIIIAVGAKTGYNENVPYVINFIPKNESGVN